MATKKRKTITKKDLEAKIAELEAKLAISSQAGETAQTQQAPPPPPKPPEPQQTTTSRGGSSRQQELEAYERDYLIRLEKQKQEAEAQRAAEELEAEKAAQSTTQGSMPQGWKPS